MNRRALLLGLLSAPLAKLLLGAEAQGLGAGKGHPDRALLGGKGGGPVEYEHTSGYCQVLPDSDTVRNIKFEFTAQTDENWAPAFTYTTT